MGSAIRSSQRSVRSQRILVSALYEAASRLCSLTMHSYLAFYAVIVFCVVLAFLLYNVVYTFGALRASRKIHEKLISSLIGSSFRWVGICCPNARANNYVQVAGHYTDVTNDHPVHSRHSVKLAQNYLDCCPRALTILQSTIMCPCISALSLT